MRYRRKPVIVNAVQWNCTRKSYEAIEEMGASINCPPQLQGYENKPDNVYEKINTIFISTVNWEHCAVNKDDYVVKENSGVIKVYDKFTFEDNHEPIL